MCLCSSQTPKTHFPRPGPFEVRISCQPRFVDFLLHQKPIIGISDSIPGFIQSDGSIQCTDARHSTRVHSDHVNISPFAELPKISPKHQWHCAIVLAIDISIKSKIAQKALIYLFSLGAVIRKRFYWSDYLYYAQ